MSAACQPGFVALCTANLFFFSLFLGNAKAGQTHAFSVCCVWREADGGVTLVCSLALKGKKQNHKNKTRTHTHADTQTDRHAAGTGAEERASLPPSPPPLPSILPSVPSSHSDICCPPLSLNTPRAWDMKWPVEAERVGCVFRCIGCDGLEAIDTRRVITPRSGCLSSSSGPSISHGHWLLCVCVCVCVYGWVGGCWSHPHPPPFFQPGWHTRGS